MPFPLLPILGAGASILGGIFGQRSQNKAAQQQADLYNRWLQQYMGTGQSLFNQAQAGGWNPFGPQTSTSSGTSSQQGGSSYTNRPFITKEYAPLDELMRGIMTGRLSSGTGLPAGYAENAARAINQSYEGADAAARNLAAKRGLSGEQSYAVASPVSRARAGALADMRGQMPLLARQLQNEDIGITQGLQSAFGRGEKGTTSTWSTGQTSGTQTNPFTASDLSSLMRVLAPPAPMQSGQTGNSTLGSGLSSLGSLLGFLSAQQGGNMSANTPNATMMNLYNNYPAFWNQ